MDVNDYRWNSYNYYNHNHNHNQVAAFGRWDYGYTQCYEGTARQFPGLVRYNDAFNPTQDTDLYVTADLYQNDVVTPAVIVVPRSRQRKGGIEGKKQEKRENSEWEYSSYKNKECSPTPTIIKSKPIDQDLYKIPSEFLHLKPKRKRRLGLFSSCLMPCA